MEVVFSESAAGCRTGRFSKSFADGCGARLSLRGVCRIFQSPRERRQAVAGGIRVDLLWNAHGNPFGSD